MRILTLLIAATAFAATAAAEPLKVERIDIVDHGIYAIETGEQTHDPSMPTGTISLPAAASNIEETRAIPARVGVEFGFRYIVVGEPAGAEVTLDMVNVYPPQGLSDPAAAEPLLESRYQRTKLVGDTVYLGYGFEEEWETEPGTWTFQIWYDGRMLAEQSFTVAQ